MKKILWLSLVVVLVLTGCSSNKDLEDRISELKNNISELEKELESSSDLTIEPTNITTLPDDITSEPYQTLTPAPTFVEEANSQYDYILDGCSVDKIVLRVEEALNYSGDGAELDDLYKYYDVSNGTKDDVITVTTYGNANVIDIKYIPASDVQNYIENIQYYRIYDIQEDIQGKHIVKYHYDYDDYSGQGPNIKLAIKDFDLAPLLFEKIVKLEEDYWGCSSGRIQERKDSWLTFVNVDENTLSLRSKILMTYSEQNQCYYISVSRRIKI